MKYCSQNGGGISQGPDQAPGDREQSLSNCNGDGCGPPVEFSATIRTNEGDEVFHVRVQYEETPDMLDSFAALDRLVWRVRSFQDNS